ncbi:MAG: hypothetical protein CVV37_02365 [Nitrospira bacterium HGW-Nitrospira-1]|nr:MAG: hypothetical protein CVV37_02365 [Nitrospira bacterium HGW-Nitrospira-1]
MPGKTGRRYQNGAIAEKNGFLICPVIDYPGQRRPQVWVILHEIHSIRRKEAQTKHVLMTKSLTQVEHCFKLKQTGDT